MNKFWDNVLKFPRFLISVTLGLILTIISPFFVLFRKPSTSFFFITSFAAVLAILTVIIEKMLNTGCC